MTEGSSSFFNEIKENLMGGTPKELEVGRTYETTKQLGKLDLVIATEEYGVQYGMEHKRGEEFEERRRLQVVLTKEAQQRADKEKAEREVRLRALPHVKSDPQTGIGKYKKHNWYEGPSLSIASGTRVTAVAIEKQDQYASLLPMVALRVQNNIDNVTVYPGGYTDVTQSIPMRDIVTIEGMTPQEFMDQQLVAVRGGEKTLNSLKKPSAINIFKRK